VTELLRALGRDELRAVCRAHNLGDGGRSRTELAHRILAAIVFPGWDVEREAAA